MFDRIGFRMIIQQGNKIAVHDTYRKNTCNRLLFSAFCKKERIGSDEMLDMFWKQFFYDCYYDDYYYNYYDDYYYDYYYI